MWCWNMTVSVLSILKTVIPSIALLWYIISQDAVRPTGDYRIHIIIIIFWFSFFRRAKTVKRALATKQLFVSYLPLGC